MEDQESSDRFASEQYMPRVDQHGGVGQVSDDHCCRFRRHGQEHGHSCRGVSAHDLKENQRLQLSNAGLELSLESRGVL